MTHRPRTFNELAAVTGVPKLKMARALKAINAAVPLRLPRTSAADFLPRFASLLQLQPRVLQAAKFCVEESDRNLVNGVATQPSLAAAALFVASRDSGEEKDKRTEAQIARVVGVTASTVKKAVGRIDKGTASGLVLLPPDYKSVKSEDH